jgi:hypothetical protein
MRVNLTKGLAVLFLIGTMTQASAQGGGGGAGSGSGGSSSGAGAAGSGAGGTNGTGSQSRNGVPTQNSPTFSRPLQSVAPLAQPYGSTTNGVGTAPNGKPIGTAGSGPGSPAQPYDSGAQGR